MEEIHVGCVESLAGFLRRLDWVGNVLLAPLAGSHELLCASALLALQKLKPNDSFVGMWSSVD